MKRPLFLLFCLICLAIVLRYPRRLQEDPVFPQGDSYYVRVTGIVDSYEKKESSFSILLADCRISWDNQLYRCDRMLVSVKTDPQVRPGNELWISGSLSPFQPARNPGNMNWQLYYRSLHISYRLYAEDLRITDPRIFWLKDALLSLRDRWMTRINQMEDYWQDHLLSLFSFTDTASVLTALLLGNPSFLSETTYSLYETAGMLPLLSISGLHISLIGGMILWLGKKVRLPLWFSRLLSSLLLLLYWQLCGGKVPAGRAAILFACMNFAPAVRRSYDPLSALSLAGILFLLGSPLLLFQSAFLLSFGAMFGIYLVGPAIQSFICALLPAGREASKIPVRRQKYSAGPHIRSAGRYLGNAVPFAVSLQLSLLPLTLSLFFRYPVYTCLVNLFVLPLAPPLLLFGILGLLLSEVSLSMGAWFLLPCRIILWGYDRLCRYIALLPGASLLLGRPAPARIAIYYLLLFLFVSAVKRLHSLQNGTHAAASGTHRRSVLLKNLSFLLLLSLLPSLLLPLPSRKLQVTFMDVGQGDCALIRSPSGTTILIDGGSSDLSRVTEDRLIPFLESQGIDRLDYVFLSHTDEDHTCAVTGWLEAGYAIGAMVLPQLNENLSSQASYLAVQETARRYQIPLLFFCTGDLWQEDGLSLLCVGPQPADSPAGGSYASLNSASLVLLMEYQGVRILFTGDCGGEGEDYLVRELAARHLTCHILKAGHHGSRTSTGEALLSQLRPSLCIISCGVNNRYRHPSPETLARLDSAGVSYHITADCGAVWLQIRNGEIRLKTMLASPSR